jgi:hypothetical protein
VSSLRQVPNLPELIAKHKIKMFVETGCGEGDALRYADELGLEPRFSCDLNPANVAKCAAWGSVFEMDSLQFLADLMLKPMNQHAPPCLFWLDAHFPEHHGFEGATLEQRWPLLSELRILARKRRIEKDLVICDDMHVIHQPDNPTYHAWLDPYFKIEGVTMKDLTWMLPLDATIHNIDTGILVLEPRE